MRKLIILKDGQTKLGPDFVSQVLQMVLTSIFVKYVGTTQDLN